MRGSVISRRFVRPIALAALVSLLAVMYAVAWPQSASAASPTGVTSTTENGTYNAPDVIWVTVSFDEAVTVTGTPQLTLETGGTDAVANYFSGSSLSTLTFKYIVAEGHTSADLDYVWTDSLTLNSGTISDGAGNAATLTLATPGATGSLSASKDLVINTDAPVTASVTADDKVYSGNNAANISACVLSGVIGDDIVTCTAGGPNTFDTQDIGTDRTVTARGITLGGADAANYSLTSETDTDLADITELNLTISGTTASNKVYDGNTTATLGFGGAALVGVVDGDTVTINSAGATGTFADEDVADAIAVTVAGVALAGADAGNYTVSQPAGVTANITAKTVTVAVTANDKVFDGNTVATISACVLTQAGSGVIAPDVVTCSEDDASFDTAAIGTNKTVTATGIVLAGADAGNYTLNGDTDATDLANILDPNLPPDAYLKTIQLTGSGPIVIVLRGTDTDAADCDLTFSIISGPVDYDEEAASVGTLGPITSNACGPIDGGFQDTANVTFTPNPAFEGIAVFVFRVNDGTANSNAAYVYIVSPTRGVIGCLNVPTSFVVAQGSTLQFGVNVLNGAGALVIDNTDPTVYEIHAGDEEDDIDVLNVSDAGAPVVTIKVNASGSITIVIEDWWTGEDVCEFTVAITAIAPQTPGTATPVPVNPVGTPPTLTTSAPNTAIGLITPAQGGSVVATGNTAISVKVPPGAVTNYGGIQVTTVTGAAAPTPSSTLFRLGSMLVDIRVTDATGAPINNAVLGQAAEICLPYNAADALGAFQGLEGLDIWRYNDNSKQWEKMTSIVNPVTGLVCAKTNQFSVFAIGLAVSGAAPTPQATATPPPGATATPTATPRPAAPKTGDYAAGPGLLGLVAFAGAAFVGLGVIAMRRARKSVG